MFRLSVVLICVATVLAGDFKVDKGLISQLKIGAGKYLTEFLAGNPKVAMIHESTNDPTTKSHLVKYTLGARTEGDELVGKAAAKQKWDSLQNVTLKISYPREGVVGKLINYVEIRVNQSSILSSATIISGGLNQRQITIQVNAVNTHYFEHGSFIYGY